MNKECCLNCKFRETRPIKNLFGRTIGWDTLCGSKTSPYRGTLINDMIWCNSYKQINQPDKTKP